VLSAIEKDENMITSICVAVPGSRRRYRFRGGYPST
jgi:hypothetical protein